MERSIQGVVLFANLQDEPLYDALGEPEANALVDGAIATLEECIGAHSGRVVRKIGAEIEAYFPDVAFATAAAARMQRRMAEQAVTWPGGSCLCVGLASGPLIVREDGDLYGDTVGIASRAVNFRRKQGIVLSGDAVERLRPEQRATCRRIHVVKGAWIEMFEMPWK
jgi:adenylate cyclase